MNLLPFVFAILIVLSYATVASYQSFYAAQKSLKAFSSSKKTELKLLRKKEAFDFKNLPGIPNKKLKNTNKSSLPRTKKSKNIPMNPECAKVNLFPILERGKNQEIVLYKFTASMLAYFYKDLFNESEIEKFLDAILNAATLHIDQHISVPLEILNLNNPSFQNIYYRALKGTKNEFPSLKEFLKIEKNSSKICLFDAHPNLLAFLFGSENSLKLYESLKEPERNSIDLDTISLVTHNKSIHLKDPSIWTLIDFKKKSHAPNLKTTISSLNEETGLYLRKEVEKRTF
jgi:hypothetical protein